MVGMVDVLTWAVETWGQVPALLCVLGTVAAQGMISHLSDGAGDTSTQGWAYMRMWGDRT